MATAISELARNILLYAKRGEVIMAPAERRGSWGLVITARDEGDGIADIRLAMQDGDSWTTSRSCPSPGRAPR